MASLAHARACVRWAAGLPAAKGCLKRPARCLSRAAFDSPKTSILIEIGDEPGSLHEALRYFWKYDVNICRIESRPGKSGEAFQFFVDFDGQQGEEPVDRLLEVLQRQTRSLFTLSEKEVPWFPRHVSDLDSVANRILDAGTALQADHPGFKDQVYRSRRNTLAKAAREHRYGNRIPHIPYTPEEIGVWRAVWDRIAPLHEEYACREYLAIIRDMQARCGYSRDSIPQQEDISEYLQRRTGFRLRPVAGLLSSRDFLNGLAFRTFFCTQYIRHHSRPLYTPEPDICHELLGHAPMFADPDFADFSQEFGLASLGASDDEITKLARCYWHSVEFGLCRQKGELKAYGAGLLSSFGELEYACSPDRPTGGTEDRPELAAWDPAVAGQQEYPITTYQPKYFVASSLNDAKQQMRDYCEGMAKPFHARYNPLSQTVWVDRAVRPKRLEPDSDEKGGPGTDSDGEGLGNLERHEASA